MSNDANMSSSTSLLQSETGVPWHSHITKEGGSLVLSNWLHSDLAFAKQLLETLVQAYEVNVKELLHRGGSRCHFQKNAWMSGADDWKRIPGTCRKW